VEVQNNLNAQMSYLQSNVSDINLAQANLNSKFLENSNDHEGRLEKLEGNVTIINSAQISANDEFETVISAIRVESKNLHESNMHEFNQR